MLRRSLRINSDTSSLVVSPSSLLVAPISCGPLAPMTPTRPLLTPRRHCTAECAECHHRTGRCPSLLLPHCRAKLLVDPLASGLLIPRPSASCPRRPPTSYPPPLPDSHPLGHPDSPPSIPRPMFNWHTDSSDHRSSLERTTSGVC